MNLQKARVIFVFTFVAILVACNLAYMTASAQSRWTEYANQVDQLGVKIISLVLLVGVVVFAALRAETEESDSC